MANDASSAASDLRLYDGKSEQSRRARPPFHLLLATLLAAAMVPVATLFDISISRWFIGKPLPGDFSKSIQLTEFYAHGIGVIFILILILRMVPHKRWCVPRLATLAFGAGALSVLVKTFVLRGRPNRLNLSVAPYDAAWRWTFDWSLDHVAAFESSVRSFPSGHSAIATGLTVGLCLMFPRGRVIFAFLAAMAMLQRVACYAHYASDLMGGLAIGLLWAYVCLSPKLLGALFDKLEPQGQGFETSEVAYTHHRAA